MNDQKAFNGNKNSANQERNIFDLTEIIGMLLRRKWLIILPVILVTAVTFGGSYLITPEYESSAIIYIGSPVKLSVDLQRLLGNASQGYHSPRDQQYELRSLQNEITSSPFIGRLASMLKLDQDPDLEKAAMGIKASQPEMDITQIKLYLLVKRLRDKISVSYAGKDQIKITVQSTDPFMARDMTQTLGEVFISEKMKQELGTVRLSQDFSYEQLAKYEKNLQDKIDARTNFEKEYMKNQLDNIVASDENRKAINSEIEGANIDIEEGKDEERRLIGLLSEAGLTSRMLKLEESSDLRRLKSDMNDHLESVANLMLQYTWSAPEILNFNARLYRILRDIEDEHRKLVGQQFSDYDDNVKENLIELFNVRMELDVYYSKVNELTLALNDLRNKIEMIPEYQARLDQLDREIEAARDLRDKFREQQESSQISQALLRESKYKFIEPAKVPLAPFKPQRSKIIALGFLLGLVIGGGAVLLIEMFDKSFRKVDEVEKLVGIRVIGVIPHIESLKRMKIRK